MSGWANRVDLFARERMGQTPRSLQLLFFFSLGIFALAFATGISYTLTRLNAPPGLSANPVQLANVLLREQDLSAAVVELQGHEAVVPRFNQSVLDLAKMLSQLNRDQEALEAYRRAAVTLPKDPEAHALLGAELFRRRRFEEASESFRIALELNPRDPDARENLAVSYLNSGRTVEAIELYAQIIESGAGTASTHLILSQSHAINGDRALAFEHAKIAFRLEPSNAEIRAHYDALAREAR
jgi:tetratricopeptide (TPR) repeat protein